MNDRQKLFAEEYVASGYKPAYQAYMKAYPDAAVRTAQCKASALLKRDDVKAYIKELQHDRFEELNITADRIAEELAKMAFAEFDENNSASTKQKALELLGKQLGLYTQKIDANVEGKTEITLTIGDETNED